MLLGQRIQLWLCVLILGLGRGVPALPAAERMRTSWTSRQPSFGFAWSINATTPETSGAAEDVPLKVLV